MPLPRLLAEFNKVATNRLIGLVADRLPGFALVCHKGRTSGRDYWTPVTLFERPGGYRIALTYGQGDWVRNVMNAGRAQVITGGEVREIANPRVVHDPQHAGVPLAVQGMLWLARVDDFLLVDDVSDSAPRGAERVDSEPTRSSWASSR